MMTRINEDNLLSVIIKGSLLLVAILSIGGYCFHSVQMGSGILAGGIIALLNFFWMRNVLQRIIGLKPDNPGGYMLIRSLSRITATAFAIYAVIVSGWFSIAGLFLGLSVIVINIIVLSIYCAMSTGG